MCVVGERWIWVIQDLARVKSPRVETPSLHDLIWEEESQMSLTSSASIMLMRQKEADKTVGAERQLCWLGWPAPLASL